MEYSVIRRSAILFFLCCALLLSVAAVSFADAQTGEDHPIEVFVGGKRYDSLEGYKEAMAVVTQEDVAFDEEAREMFDQAVRVSKSPLDLTFDPKKMKTVRIGPSVHGPSRNSVSHERALVPEVTNLKKIGLDAGINRVVSDFKSSGQDGQILKVSDLENVLRNSLVDSNQPLLLISDHKSVRVLALDPSDDKDKTASEASFGSVKHN